MYAIEKVEDLNVDLFIEKFNEENPDHELSHLIVKLNYIKNGEDNKSIWVHQNGEENGYVAEFNTEDVGSPFYFFGKSVEAANETKKLVLDYYKNEFNSNEFVSR